MDLAAVVRSSGDKANVSLSKVGMLAGVLVACFVVIYQTVHNTLTIDTFDTFLYCTLGANTINKGISIVQAIKGAPSNVNTTSASSSGS